MTISPLVSIIVPAYNAGTVLHATLRSIQTQTWPHWQAIVVDDGSTDDTAKVAAQFVESDSRFRLIRQQNTGVAGARNTALSVAMGEWIAFVDADDVWLPEKLERQWRATRLHPDRDFFFSNYLIWDGTADLEVRYSAPRKVPSGDLRKRLAFFNLFGISSVLLRRELLARAGGFDQSVSPGEDWDMWLRIADNGFRPHGLFEPLLRYRVWPGNASGDPLHMAEINVHVLEKGWERNRHKPSERNYARALNIARGKLELARVRNQPATNPAALTEAVKKAWQYSPTTAKWLLWYAGLNCPSWLGGESFSSAVLRKIRR